MAGLISSTTTPITSSGSLTTANGVTSINPAQITQTQDWQNTADQTVAGQLSAITASNSPLMQQARTRATQGMNGRGLVNSSMAAGAADSAMYDAAIPIAQADAAQASKVAGYNVDTRNTAGLRNMEASNWAAGVNAGQANDFSKIGVNQANQQSNMRLASDLSMGQAAQQQGFDLAKMDRNAALTLQQMTEQQRNNLATLAAQQGYNLQTMSAQQINELAKMDRNQQFNLQTLQQQQGFQSTQSALDRSQQTALADKQIAANKELQTLQQANDLAKIDKQVAGQKEIVGTQTEAAKSLAEIEATYKTITQGSSAAQGIMSGMQTALTNLSTIGKDYSPEKYAAAERQIRQNAQDALEMIGELAGNIDLSTYLSQPTP